MIINQTHYFVYENRTDRTISIGEHKFKMLLAHSSLGDKDVTTLNEDLMMIGDVNSLMSSWGIIVLQAGKITIEKQPGASLNFSLNSNQDVLTITHVPSVATQ